MVKNKCTIKKSYILSLYFGKLVEIIEKYEKVIFSSVYLTDYRINYK